MDLFFILNYLFETTHQSNNEENDSDMGINTEFAIDLYLFLESSGYLLQNSLS